MSKNLTRKGLAFGALVALSSTLIAGSPASAAGLYVAGYVNLAPTLGAASQLNTLQAKSLDLTGSFAGAAATGGSLKFLVTDADKVIKADVDVNASTVADDVTGITTLAANASTFTTIAVSGTVVTMTTTSAHTFAVGDQIIVAGTTSTTTATTTDVADAAKINTTAFVTEVGTNTIKYSIAALAGVTPTIGDALTTVTLVKTAETGNATRDEIAAAPLGSRSVLGVTASVKARATDGSFIVRTADTLAAGSDNVLRLVSTAAADTSATATVTAWIDNNDDDVIDTGDYVSETKTVKFLKNADVTFVTELSAPVVGLQALTAYVSATPDINLAQLGASNGITVLINMNGAEITGVAAANANYDSVSGKLKALEDSTGALVAGTYKAQARYGVDSSNVAIDRGAAVYQTPETATKDISTVATPAGANSASLAGTAVLTGTKSVTITSAVKSWTTYNATAGSRVEAAVAAGVKAKVTITKVALASASVITAGGKTLASTGTSIEFETTTNADGKVVFDLVSNNGTKTDSVSVVVSALDANTLNDGDAAGTTQGWKASSTTTLLWQDATVASLVEVGTVGTSAERNVAKGGSLVLNYEVRDNFGALVTATGYRVALTVTSASTAAATATVGTPLVAGGKVSFTVVDQTVGSTGYYSILGSLQKLNTAGTSYDAVSSMTDTVKVNVGTAAASSVTVPANATTGIALSDDVFVAQDLRLDANTNTYTTIGYAVGVGAGFTVNGVVRDATGAPVAGAPVVVAAKGLALVAANASTADATLAIDTTTVYTNANGEYSVVAFSHTAGDVVISVTSGAATKSVTAKFSYATTADKDTKVSITGSDVSSAGRTNNLVVALTDKWGNAIKGAIAVSVSLSGAGYLASYPTAVSAVDGKTNLVLITGANDSGTATITVTYDVASSDTDVVATKAITVGAAAVAPAVTASVAGIVGYVATTVRNASGKAVTVTVNGRVLTPRAPNAAAQLYRFRATAGKTTVVVKVDGVTVASRTVTVK